MSEVPKNEVTQADIEQWYKLKAELGRVKSAEALLRMKIFKGYFPEPVEGTNRATLGGGYDLKATHAINREVDPGTVTTMADAFRAAGMVMEDLVRWKPELSVTAYRKLNADQTKLFDQCLIIKPGSPQLEVVKEKGAKATAQSPEAQA
jgi:hypothetical protein